VENDKVTEIMLCIAGWTLLGISIADKIATAIIRIVKKFQRREKKMANDVANIRTGQIAAATAVVGYDLMTGIPEQRTPYARIIDGFALVGSAAAGDTVVDLIINGTKKGSYANTSTGVAIDQNKDLMGMDLFVPANSLIQVVVTDAASTNAVVCQIEMHAPKKTFKKSYTGYRRSSAGYRRPATGSQTRRW